MAKQNTGATPNAKSGEMVSDNMGEKDSVETRREGTLVSAQNQTLPLLESATLATDEAGNLQESLLVENEHSHVQILEGYSDNYARAKFLVTTVDVANRNDRVYERALAEKETQMQFNGRVLGQSKHPQSEPDILDQFIVWEKAMLEGDDEYFIAKIIPTQRGKDFVEIAKAGASVATSRRGSGELREGKDKNGKKAKIINTNTYQIHGVDVLYPGVQSNHKSVHTIHFEAYDPNAESQVNEELTPMPENQTANTVVEEVVADTTTETAIPETQETPAKETPKQDTQTSTPAAAQAVQTERASVTATTPQNAPVPSEVIEKLTADIQAKQTLITTLNVQAVNLAADNAVKQEQIKAMTDVITGLNAETTRLSKAISEMNDAVQERTKLISERDATLAKRNQTLADRQALLVQAHKTIQERDDAIAERNKHITHKNGLLSLRDETIAKQQKDLAERNQTIAKQDLEIASQDATIQERNQAIAAERQSLQERDAIIAASDKELMERNAELLAMQEQLLTEKVNVEAEKERNKAFQHLFEKVQVEGAKASWFIFNDLRNCATVQEVEEKFVASKERGIALIEGVARVAGKAVYTETAATDADEVNSPKNPKVKSPKNDKTEDENEAFQKQANAMARIAGLSR